MRLDDRCTYPLELHCALLWGGQLERDLLTEIWAQADRKSFYGAEAFALSEDWEFLYLTLHAARHGLSSLKWLVDLDRLSSRGPDWGKSDEHGKALGMGRRGAIYPRGVRFAF